ncbi:MAG: OadG family protein [Prevotella sp.]|nr:OadG family protein [Prevotella sp.]
MDNFALGLTLMVVGMVTVFAILLIVIYLSRVLIMAVNRIAPEEPVPGSNQRRTTVINPSVMRVIALAVDKVTGGKGRVESVEKM